MINKRKILYNYFKMIQGFSPIQEIGLKHIADHIFTKLIEMNASILII